MAWACRVRAFVGIVAYLVPGEVTTTLDSQRVELRHAAFVLSRCRLLTTATVDFNIGNAGKKIGLEYTPGRTHTQTECPCFFFSPSILANVDRCVGVWRFRDFPQTLNLYTVISKAMCPERVRVYCTHFSSNVRSATSRSTPLTTARLLSQE